MRFLINRTDAIGDNILTMPMAQAIKELFPEAKVGIITSKICQDLYEHHPYYDDVFILDKKSSYYTKIRTCIEIFKKFNPSHYCF